MSSSPILTLGHYVGRSRLGFLWVLYYRARMGALWVLGSHGHTELCPGTVLSALAWPGKGRTKERMTLTAAGGLQGRAHHTDEVCRG